MNNIGISDGGCLFLHFLCRRVETYEKPHLCFFTIKYAGKVADHRRANLIASFYGSEKPTPWASRTVREENLAINPAICSLFLLAKRVRVEKIVCPPLKLIFVFLRELHCRCKITRHSFGFVFHLADARRQARFDHLDCMDGNVDSDPLPTKALRSLDRCSAAAEWIKHHVALFGRGRHYAIKQCQRFLRRIAESFGMRARERFYVGPDGLDWNATQLVEVKFLPRVAGSGIVKPSFIMQFLNRCFRITPCSRMSVPFKNWISFVGTSRSSHRSRCELATSFRLNMLVCFSDVFWIERDKLLRPLSIVRF